MVTLNEALADHILDHRLYRVEISFHIEEGTWLLVNAELPPSPLFDDLFERSRSARKGNECLGDFRYFCFPFMHIFYDMQTGKAGVCSFSLNQQTRNDATDATTF